MFIVTKTFGTYINTVAYSKLNFGGVELDNIIHSYIK